MILKDRDSDMSTSLILASDWSEILLVKTKGSYGRYDCFLSVKAIFNFFMGKFCSYIHFFSFFFFFCSRDFVEFFVGGSLTVRLTGSGIVVGGDDKRSLGNGRHVMTSVVTTMTTIIIIVMPIIIMMKDESMLNTSTMKKGDELYLSEEQDRR